MHVLMLGSGRLSAGRAVRRLRKLADGGEIALTGNFRGTSSAAPLLGVDAALAWLDSLDGVAMFLHDDASIHPPDVNRLRQAHAASERVVAPATGTDRVGRAASSLPVLVGTPRPMAALLAEPPGDPTGQVEHIDDLKLEHPEDCKSFMEHRPLLVASMIVRDEATRLGACLDSLEGFVDRVEVVDTGSIDDTIAVAKRHGASVTTATWNDDFAAARNVALDRARDAQYVLHVDADERVAVNDPIAFRDALDASDLRAARVPMRNIAEDKVTSEFEAVRIFSTDGTRWVGRVHEYPADVDGAPLDSGQLGGLRIDHFGYDAATVANKDKWNRNVKLAEAAYKSEPSFKSRLDLARSLAWRSDDDRAFALFREAAADMTGASPAAAAFVLAHVAIADQIEGDLSSALQTANEAIRLCSGEFVAHLARARAWRTQDDDVAIVDAHLDRVDTDLAPPMFDTAASRHMTNNLTAGALARLGSHTDAVELAAAILADDPAYFDEWKSLATLPEPLRLAMLPLLASMDTSASFVDALVGEIPMTELAQLVLANTQALTPTPHAVITGIMAAVLSGDENTAAAIAEAGVAALDGEQCSATAERCRLRGALTVAALLEPSFAPA